MVSIVKLRAGPKGQLVPLSILALNLGEVIENRALGCASQLFSG